MRSKSRDWGFIKMRGILTILFALCIIPAFGGMSFAIHDEIPAETEQIIKESRPSPPSISQTTQNTFTLQGLINLLKKKGLITERELREEIEKIQKKQ